MNRFHPGPCRYGWHNDDLHGVDADRYRRNEIIRIKQQFTENVVMEGDVNVGSTLGYKDDNVRRAAGYTSGSVTDTLTFEYRTTGDDLDIDIDGILVPDSDCGGEGSIKADDDSNKVNSVYIGHMGDEYQKVYGKAYVKDVTMISSPASGDTYEYGENIEIQAHFDRPVDIDGLVYMVLRIGEDTGEWASAQYNRGRGTGFIVFRHTVDTGEMDPDGIIVPNGNLGPEGQRYGFGGSGKITARDSENNRDFEVSPYYDGPEDLTEHKIDSTPRVTGIEVISTPPNGKHYRIGDEIKITATYDQNVSVTTPLSIPLTIGDGFSANTYAASYSSDSRDNLLVFEHTVGKNQRDDDGISISEGRRILDDGTIYAYGTNLEDDRDLPELPDQDGHTVYAYLPWVQSAAFTSKPDSDDTYVSGEAIEVSLTFQYEVDVSGMPAIKILIGEADTERNAVYSSGSGTDTINFEYDVRPQTWTLTPYR